MVAKTQIRHTAVIVFAYGGGVNQYAADNRADCLVEIDKCPNCETEGSLVGHGVYWRKPRDGKQGPAIFGS